MQTVRQVDLPYLLECIRKLQHLFLLLLSWVCHTLNIKMYCTCIQNTIGNTFVQYILGMRPILRCDLYSSKYGIIYEEKLMIHRWWQYLPDSQYPLMSRFLIIGWHLVGSCCLSTSDYKAVRLLDCPIWHFLHLCHGVETYLALYVAWCKAKQVL